MRLFVSTEARPWRSPVALAIALHAVVLGVLLLVPRAAGHVAAPAEGAEEPSAIELDDDAVPTTAGRTEEEKQPEPTTTGAIAAREAASVRGRAAAHEAEPAPQTAQANGTPEPNAANEADAAGEIMLVRPSSIGLGAAGTNPFLARGALPEMTPEGEVGPRRAPRATARPEAPTRAEAKAAVEGALKRDARERERELGLGPEGPVVTALGQAAYATETPVKGRAVFLAIANGEGDVVGLTVLSSDGTSGWSSAAREALAALKGQKLRMPAGAKRAEMKIEVVSEWKLPSGHDPGVDVDLFHIPLKKGEGDKSTHVSMLDPLPKFRVDQLEVAPGVKVPVVSVGLDVIAVQGDPADIGAKPRRVVHARLVDSKVL